MNRSAPECCRKSLTAPRYRATGRTERHAHRACRPVAERPLESQPGGKGHPSGDEPAGWRHEARAEEILRNNPLCRRFLQRIVEVGHYLKGAHAERDPLARTQ